MVSQAQLPELCLLRAGLPFSLAPRTWETHLFIPPILVPLDSCPALIYIEVIPYLAPPANLKDLVTSSSHRQTHCTRQTPGDTLRDPTGHHPPVRYDPLAITSEPNHPTSYVPLLWGTHPHINTSLATGTLLEGAGSLAEVSLLHPILHVLKSNHFITKYNEVDEALFTLSVCADNSQSASPPSCGKTQGPRGHMA